MRTEADPHQVSISDAVRARPAYIRQQDIADRLGIGRTAVTERLAGRARWQLADVVALADMLGVGVDDLLGRRS